MSSNLLTDDKVQSSWLSVILNLNCWYDFCSLKHIWCSYPQRVSKKKATVKYMFHKPEDVRWFKVRNSPSWLVSLTWIYLRIYHDWSAGPSILLQPVEVWTKCGRRGRITEPLGTHGMVLTWTNIVTVRKKDMLYHHRRYVLNMPFHCPWKFFTCRL